MTFDLAVAIKAVQPAPPVLLVTVPPGDYPAVVLRGLNPSAVVRIVASGARFAGLQMTGCSNLSFEGLEVHNPAPASASSPVVFIQSSSDIGFSGGKVSGDRVGGLLLGKGISIANSARVTISGNEVFDLFKGISLASSPGTVLHDNDVHDVRTSPIDGGGDLTLAQIIGNHIHDIVPEASQGDHSDGIHLFTKNALKPNDGIVIQANRMEQADAGGTLGINLEGTPGNGVFTNIKVAENVLKWNNNQGITTNWVQSGEFTDNVLLPAPGLDDPKHAPAIVFRNSGPDVKVTGNTVKLGPSMKPFAGQNTFLTPAQIAQFGGGA